MVAVRAWPVALAVVLAASACGWNDAVDSRTATAGLPSVRRDVEEHDWVLDPDASTITVPDGVAVTLSVVGDDVSGTAPCNTYRGRFDLGGDLGDGGVEVTDIALTHRACPDPAMRAEDDFLTALRAVDDVEVDEDDDRMTLTGDDGTRLAFRAYDADELLTATWNVVNLATPDGITSVLTGTEPAVTFDPDGDVTLYTGCATATATGTWALDGHTVDVDGLATTDPTCPATTGDEAMDHATALVHALEAADHIEIAPGNLVVVDADGSITLVAVQP